MNSADSSHSQNAELLTGRLAEYQELLEVLAERPGLTVISSDPWSGASGLLSAAIAELEDSRVCVDARACANSLDLAMAIADSAISSLAPKAAAWWSGASPPASTAGLALSRALSVTGIDLTGLRNGSGLGLRRLSEAIELLVTLADGDAILAVDHLGLMLSALPDDGARELLGELRSARQRHSGLDLVLVEHSDGPIGQALVDPDHPLYQAGNVLRFHRPRPARFVADLVVTRAWTDVPVEMIGSAAELTAGVPALTWRVVEGAPVEGESIQSRALSGWKRLRETTAPSTARQWDLLRRIHPVAQSVIAAMAVGLRPHAAAANPKSINDALNRLRGLGMVWQPEERRWSIGDPLLAAWVRGNAPPWAARRHLAD